MDRTQKETFVSELRERMNRAPVLYLTDFSGLNVKAITELRSSLRKSGAEYVVVKNRLAQRVLGEIADFPDITDSLTGPTGFVFGYEDAAAAAKALSEFAKAHDQKPTFKIAKLPPREQLLAELAGAFEAPMAALAAALGAKLQETAGLIDALREERAKAG